MTRRASFQFYPDDFLSGTTTMSRAAVGGYISMLCVSWGIGPIPNTPTALTKALSLGPGDPPFKQIWGEVRPKWTRGKRGWTNSRLEHVRATLERYIEISRQNGQRGGRPKSHGLSVTPPSKKPRGFAPKQPGGFVVKKPMGFHMSAPDPTPSRNPNKTSPSPSPSPKTDQDHQKEQCADARRFPQVLLKIAHIVLDARDRGDVEDRLSELAEEVKTRAAHAQIPYDSTAITQALTSAEVQRKRGRP